MKFIFPPFHPHLSFFEIAFFRRITVYLQPSCRDHGGTTPRFRRCVHHAFEVTLGSIVKLRAFEARTPIPTPQKTTETQNKNTLPARSTASIAMALYCIFRSFYFGASFNGFVAERVRWSWALLLGRVGKQHALIRRTVCWFTSRLRLRCRAFDSCRAARRMMCAPEL